MKRKVGVAIATYMPQLPHWSAQVDSLRAQVGVDWVAHVVDDASAPSVRKMIRDVISGDPRFVVHWAPRNRGPFATFGAALSRILEEGVDAVALSDQDDVWHSERLMAGVSLLSDRVALVHSDLRLINDDGEVLNESVWRLERRESTTDTRRTVLRNSVTGCTLTMRPDVARLALPFPNQPRPLAYLHDAWLALHALRLGDVQGLPRPLVDYRSHERNVVGVADVGLRAAIRQRRGSIPSALRAAHDTRSTLVRDFLQAVARDPLFPGEERWRRSELTPFSGRGSWSDHARLWSSTARSNDARRRLLQWYLGGALNARGRR